MKKGKPQQGAASWSGVSVALHSLPDLVHEVIGTYLDQNEISHLSVASKRTLRMYGAELKKLELFYPEDIPACRRTPALLSLLRRTQESLVDLTVPEGQHDAFGPLSIAMACGLLRCLETFRSDLTYNTWPKDADLFAGALTDITALGSLRVLQMEHNFDDNTMEDVIPVMLRALRDGACPRLESLTVGPTEHTVELFADAMHARAGRGCVGLKELTTTFYEDKEEHKEHFVRAFSAGVLQSLEEVTFVGLPETAVRVTAILLSRPPKEAPAANPLRNVAFYLYTSDFACGDGSMLVEALAAGYAVNLESLSLGDVEFPGLAGRRLIDVLERGLCPKLKSLYLSEDCWMEQACRKKLELWLKSR